MPKQVVSIVLLLAVLGTGGCDLFGWQGTPSPEPFVKIIGVMDVKSLPERDSLWTIEADTASYVPRGNLPSEVKQDSLSVSVTGIVGGHPDFYPEGYFIDVRVIQPLED